MCCGWRQKVVPGIKRTRRGASVGKGEGAYVIFRIRGGEEERLWGIHREIPIEWRAEA